MAAEVRNLAVSVDPTTAYAGDTVTLTATAGVAVNGQNYKEIDATDLAAWSVEGSSAGSKIEKGVLTISPNESAARLTVKASFGGGTATASIRIAVANVPYYDPADGQMKTVPSALCVIEGETSWGERQTESWYIATGDAMLDWVYVDGDVNLILADVCDLQVTQGIGVERGHSLTVWGQNENYNKDGSLTATSIYDQAGIGSFMDNGRITINGGKITAIGGNWAAGIGNGMDGWDNEDITINGGVVRASGGRIYARKLGGSTCANEPDTDKHFWNKTKLFPVWISSVYCIDCGFVNSVLAVLAAESY